MADSKKGVIKSDVDVSIKEMPTIHDKVDLEKDAKYVSSKPTIVNPGRFPCTDVCTFDLAMGFCAFCGLHRNERDKWLSAEVTEDDKAQILGDWNARRNLVSTSG